MMATGDMESFGDSTTKDTKLVDSAKPENVQKLASEDSSSEPGLQAEGGQPILSSDGWKYKDPKTGHEFIWSESSQQWTDTVGGTSTKADDIELNSTRTSGDASDGTQTDDQKNMVFVNGVWQYHDSGGKNLVFDNASQTWIPAESVKQESDDDEMREGEDEFAYQLRLEAKLKKKQNTAAAFTGSYTDPTDGTIFDWDAAKHGWIPRVDDDFLAVYQAGYGLNPLDTTALEKDVAATTSAALQEQAPPDPKQAKTLKRQEQRKRQAEQDKRGWFDLDEEHNRNVYVTGLPPDITAQEFEDLMAKCGIIEKDLVTNKLKLRLYEDDQGQPKGDGRCCYMKKESVDLALQILDGYELRRGVKITVERAQFALKGEYDPTKRKRVNAKLKKKLKEKQEKLLDWRPDRLKGERPKSDATVILKNLFSLDEFIGKAELIFDLQEFIKNECAKYGEIKKIMIYDNNPEGVASITFAEPEMADDCLTMTNHRNMRGRIVKAERWDGKAKYKVEETEEQRQKRLDSWQKQLQQDD